MKKQKNNVLVIGDTHIPFEHSDYLKFCINIGKQYKCNQVIHIGDLVDMHSCSYHEHEPDLWSPSQEMEIADKHLKSWFKAFPKIKLCLGNHDRLPDRKRRTVGLPSRCFKSFHEMWNLPKGWQSDFNFVIDDVMYEHGTGSSGRYAHLNLAVANRQSTVVGHNHSMAGIEYTASEKDCIFGMNVGSGINRKALAFAYGRNFKFKPIVSCGVIFNGENPQIFRMKL